VVGKSWGWRKGGVMTQSLYTHMNKGNKKKLPPLGNLLEYLNGIFLPPSRSPFYFSKYKYIMVVLLYLT
jgi:hypothetical protein